MQTQVSRIKRADFQAAVHQASQDGGFESESLQLVVSEMVSVCHSALHNSLLETSWHDVDFAPVLEHWQRALKAHHAGTIDAEGIAEFALTPMFRGQARYEFDYAAKEVAAVAYRGSTVENVARSVAKSVTGSTTDASDLVALVTQGLLDRWVEEAAKASVPHGYFAEVCFVPNWDGHCLDDMIYSCGLRARTYYMNGGFADLLPTPHLRRLLTFLNISSKDFVEAVDRIGDGKAMRKGWAEALSEGQREWTGCDASAFTVRKKADRPSTISADTLVSIIQEAGLGNTVFIAHAQVDVRALLQWNPKDEMRWTTEAGKIHVGMHDVVNGAGYMDQWPGEVVIPPGSLGFGWKGRWRYGIVDTYDLVTRPFRVEPTFSQVVPKKCSKRKSATASSKLM